MYRAGCDSSIPIRPTALSVFALHGSQWNSVVSIDVIVVPGPVRVRVEAKAISDFRLRIES